MTDYTTYTESDFITDEYFRDWVLFPSAHSESFWSAWLALHPEKAPVLMRAKALLLSMQVERFEAPEGKKEVLFRQIVARSRTPVPTHTNAFSSLWRYAAAVSVLLLVAAAWLFPFLEPEGSQTATGPKVTWLEKAAKPGEKLILRLADGSTVRLNAGASVRFPEHFQSERVVHLSGEAFFEIFPDPQRPFIISTGSYQTKVLGTSFNVSYQPQTDQIAVAVATGKVEVSVLTDSQQVYRLVPGQMASSQTGSLHVQAFESEKIYGWKDGILRFDQADLPEIATRLEQWFGCAVELPANSHLKRSFTARFKNPSLQEVLEGLSYTSGVEFTLSGKRVILTYSGT